MMNRRTLGVMGAGLVSMILVLATFGSALGQGVEPGRGHGPGGAGPGPGMMGYGSNGGGDGPGMMGGVWQTSQSAHPLPTLDDARQAFQGYIDATGNPDLALAEVMQFQFNYYASVKEQSNGRGAFELLADPQTGAVFPEFGPTMMWNTKYGHMGWWWGQQPSEPTVSAQQAQQIAQQWLDQHQPGSATETPHVFPSYYTLHALKDGTISGMLSVNAYTAQVWYHSWHGAFLAMSGASG